uniref:V-SNARE coiled-coil homology domain-containing protein n=3 Tax=Ciona intestinalis TaxID=7719 RepID=F6V0A8_CIOIN
KKKKEKLKKEKKRKGSKKVKKLKGKRERAVSRAVLEEINTNNNSNKRETVINPGRFTPHGSISNGNSPAETRTEGSFLAFNQKPRDKSPSRVSQLKQEAVTSPKVTSSEPGADKITLKPSRLSSGDLKKLHDFKKTSDDVTRDVASTSQHRKVTIESCKDDKIEEIEEPKRERAVTRRARTASVLVSSRERRKKKRLRLAKKWKRIKGKKKNVGDDSESLKNFNPKPANRNIENQNLEKLRHQVDEVKTLTQYNVVEELHKRESALIELEKNTATLEKFAESFAKTGHDIQLKKKAQNRCCGIFSGCRACWYIC